MDKQQGPTIQPRNYIENLVANYNREEYKKEYTMCNNHLMIAIEMSAIKMSTIEINATFMS